MTKLEKILSGIILLLLLLCFHYCNKPAEKIIVNLKPVGSNNQSTSNNIWDYK